jgi:His/Glu/Gln/Arg/opine family amino acid ABC transporter permease subunit
MLADDDITHYWRFFLSGTLTTLWISWFALMLGGTIGAVVAHMRISRFRPLQAFALVYTEFFRSIPPLMLFFGCYYGISYALGLNLNPFTSATLALTLTASSLMAEVVRSGIESVGSGQWLAATASGMRPIQVMRYVVWPQALRVCLPPATGVYISTLKDSSVASIIGYIELTRSGLLVRETTGNSFDVFLIVAVIYFVINYGLSLCGGALERRFRIVH